jgi:hypothetical protein
MQSISTIGLDIAKSVFQVHGVDAAGQVVLRRQLRRGVRLGILPEAAAAVALANKNARIAWALLSSGEAYNPSLSVGST